MTTTVNHHAHHPGFAGPAGLLAALSMSWRRDADARLAVELTRLGPTDDLLDVGCGPGAAARLAARTAPSVVGVDPAPIMLRVARLRARGPRYLEGTAERLPLPDGAVTVAWALATVHHWADVDAALDGLHRVLRPGGRLLAVEKDGDPDADGLRSHGWNGAQAEAFASAAARHGFTDVEVSEHDLGRRRVHAVLARRPT